jgi:hypothetical protein
MIVRHIVMACALLAAVVPATATASAGRQACSGGPPDQPTPAYDETRQFVDFQSWWRTSPGEAGTDLGHAHVGACIPSARRCKAKRSRWPTTTRASRHAAGGRSRAYAGAAERPRRDDVCRTHKLNMRADCADPRGSTNSGLLVLPLEVG